MYQLRQLFSEEGKAYIPLKNYVLSNQTQLLFPHIVSVEIILFSFGNPKTTVHKAKGHSTEMCGNYSRSETI